MATFKKRPSGRWQAQVRRKGHSLSETFALRKDAEARARRIESEIDSGKTPARKNVGDVKTFGELIDLHIEDMKEVGKAQAKEGAGRVTLGIDIGYLNTLLTHGAAVHGLPSSPEQINLGRVALKRLGLVGNGKERDRRPMQGEIDALVDYLEGDATGRDLPRRVEGSQSADPNPVDPGSQRPAGQDRQR